MSLYLHDYTMGIIQVVKYKHTFECLTVKCFLKVVSALVVLAKWNDFSVCDFMRFEFYDCIMQWNQICLLQIKMHVIELNICGKTFITLALRNSTRWQ